MTAVKENPKAPGYTEHKEGVVLRPRIKTRYDEPDRVRMHGEKWFRTSQEFVEELDINKLVARLLKGENLDGIKRAVVYGDITTAPTLQQALQTVADANEAFASLPAHIRERFQNNAVEYLKFLDDPANIPEMERLGMFKKEAVERVKTQRAKDEAEIAELRKSAKKKPESGTPESGGQPKGGSGAD